MDQVQQEGKVLATLVSSEHGFDDYEVSGIECVHRITVGRGIKRGDLCNVYCADSVKLGAPWQGNVEATLSHFSATDKAFHVLYFSYQGTTDIARRPLFRTPESVIHEPPCSSSVRSAPDEEEVEVIPYYDHGSQEPAFISRASRSQMQITGPVSRDEVAALQRDDEVF